jgi:hypothetical protein
MNQAKESAMTNESEPSFEPKAPFSWKRIWGITWEVALVFMAVALPAITILVEALTGFCGGIFFDPVPTPFHVVLSAFVPAANLLVWLGLRKGWRARGRLLGLLNGVGLSLSLIYSILFLPLAPFALLALFLFWWYLGAGLIGLLPLSPLLAFVGGLILRRRLVRAFFPEERSMPGVRVGFVLGLVLLAAASVGEAFTLVGLRWAVSDDPEIRNRGVSLLRRVNHNEMLLRISHNGNAMYDSFLPDWVCGKPVTTAKARQVYFLVTGRDAMHVKPRAGGGGLLFGRGRRVSEDLDWDNQQGGTAVGGILKGLSLQSTRMDGTLDGAAGTGYLEWTLVFRNDHEFSQREARATVALPPGAVVSRLTLWVHGEEREAAYSTRGKVREAYEKVVRARRDPVLVTTCGPDRVLVQCFPVEPDGGEMKVRLGITVPLQPGVGKNGNWALNLPMLLDRNFRLADNRGHEVWLESRSPLKAVVGVPLVCAEGPDGAWKARGSIPEPALWKAGEAVSVQATGNGTAWCRDTRGDRPAVVRQALLDTPDDKPASVLLLVDGSASMKEAAPRLAEALRQSFPEGVRLGLMIVGDGKPEQPVLRVMTRDKIEELATTLANADFEGGRCNVEALDAAWEALAAAQGPSCLVWVHGPQPLLMGDPQGLMQRLEREPGTARIFSLQVSPGPDLICDMLDKARQVQGLLPSEDPARRLSAVFKTWGEGPLLKAVYVRDEREPDAAAGVVASDHLARLWAKGEIGQLLATGREDDRGKAAELASRYHLVTPVSGAVVLETAQQFKDANLEPVSADALPTVPEPEFWLLMAAVLAVVAWQWRRRSCVHA